MPGKEKLWGDADISWTQEHTGNVWVLTQATKNLASEALTSKENATSEIEQILTLEFLEHPSLEFLIKIRENIADDTVFLLIFRKIKDFSKRWKELSKMNEVKLREYILNDKGEFLSQWDVDYLLRGVNSEDDEDSCGSNLTLSDFFRSIDLGKLPREYLQIIRAKLADDEIYLSFLKIGKDIPEDWKELSEMDTELLQAYIKGESPFFLAYNKDMRSVTQEVDEKERKYRLEYFLAIDEPRTLTEDELYYLNAKINTFEILSLPPEELEKLRKLIAMQDKDELFPFGEMGEVSRYREGIEGPGGKKYHVWTSTQTGS